ncbi:SDR family NAD(P)-dependent oxidoreductase [bacterium]|nr:SDR family NAD(P)-dependent oxidoreductase [bacterium]
MRSVNNHSTEVIWITGASSGIGEALVKRFARRNISVAITARNEEKLRALALWCQNENQDQEARADIRIFPCDVTEPLANERIAKQIKEEFGNPITIFIPCAGTYRTSDSHQSFSAREHREIMELNYFSLLDGIQAVLPDMLRTQRGQIIGVASLVGYFGLPRALGYSASKAAIINALQSLRFELRGTGVQVKVINPGFVKTPLTDKNDFPMPFLVSAEEAAIRIEESLMNSRFETHFPRKLSLLFKIFRILPQPLFEFLISRLVYGSHGNANQKEQ